MKYVRELMKKARGREKFKKICSINHGNKFLRAHGNSYYDLYSKSLEYLKHLESELKKGRKFNSLKQELNKFPPETEETENDQESLSQ